MYGRLRGPGSKTEHETHHRHAADAVEHRPSGSADSFLPCRYEFKYLIGESQAAAIEHFIRPYLHLDHYCKTQTLGSYPIMSLYLDSPQLHLCRQTLEGRKNRFKLRIRSYTDDPDYPRFFEIKRRMNAIIIKSRARVIHPDVAAVVSRLALPPATYREDEKVLRQFQFYMKSINAGPVVRIRYQRRAYEGDTENRVRVTFDRRLEYDVSNTSEVSLDASGWQSHRMPAVILEIKFTERFPVWLSQMAKCFNLRQISISKYVTSVKHSCLMFNH